MRRVDGNKASTAVITLKDPAQIFELTHGRTLGPVVIFFMANILCNIAKVVDNETNEKIEHDELAHNFHPNNISISEVPGTTIVP